MTTTSATPDEVDDVVELLPQQMTQTTAEFALRFHALVADNGWHRPASKVAFCQQFLARVAHRDGVPTKPLSLDWVTGMYITRGVSEVRNSHLSQQLPVTPTKRLSPGPIREKSVTLYSRLM